MKKVIVALTLLLGHFLPAQTTVIFKGTQEGMSKKGFKSEIKSNKEDYKKIDLGNDVNWVLAQSNGIFEPKDNLIGVKFIAKGALYPISDLGDDETKKYLEHTVDYLKNNGYTVFYEDPEKEWAWPRLFNKSNKYGIVLINYQDKKAAHLIPFEWEVKKYESKFIPYFELYSLDPFMKKWKDDNMDQKNSDF
tara:strand:+ start:50 stop:625 length:576 start_codon:yes stop_codon:yes gene_type:complete